MTRIITCIIAMLLFIQGSAQQPVIWVFGKDAGINFNSSSPIPVTYPINNYYSPSSSQCDASGNLLFYCDGRNIKDKSGNIMTGSSNPVWSEPVHIARKIISNIVPVTNDTNRYFVFMLSPSSGEPPFGTYYTGALTYSIVDMSLNGGNGGIDPDFNNILLNTELDMEFIVVPAKNCGYWLISYKRLAANGQFTAYLITGNGIAGPVYSTATITGFPYTFHNLKLTYAYEHHKLLAAIGTTIIGTFDFDYETGIVSNGNRLLDLSDFRSSGGGATFPSFCLSPNEKYLYLLGYPYETIEEGSYIKLQQIPVDLSMVIPVVSGTANTIFSSEDVLYQVPSTYVPYYSQDCDIRMGPDDKIYLLYNTAMSFMGCVNKPDLEGSACDFDPSGINLLPNTFGSYFFPAIENERQQMTISYNKVLDTLLCFTEPFTVSSGLNSTAYTFKWDDGSTVATREIRKEGIYWVQSTGSCYESQQVDTFIVRFEPPEKCHCEVFIPTAFTPNDDQLNDQFRPVIPVTCLGGSYRLLVYNRWGNLVFQSYDILKGWNGAYGNVPADIGVYYYQLVYKDEQQREHSYKGDVTLLR